MYPHINPLPHCIAIPNIYYLCNLFQFSLFYSAYLNDSYKYSCYYYRFPFTIFLFPIKHLWSSLFSNISSKVYILCLTTPSLTTQYCSGWFDSPEAHSQHFSPFQTPLFLFTANPLIPHLNSLPHILQSLAVLPHPLQQTDNAILRETKKL